MEEGRREVSKNKGGVITDEKADKKKGIQKKTRTSSMHHIHNYVYCIWSLLTI